MRRHRHDLDHGGKRLADHDLFLDPDRAAGLTDDEIVAELTQVKGIGRWTAQMFLIFSLGRLDVFPDGDLGVRVALRDLYRLSDLPSQTESLRIAAAWRPYCTVGSWYCWRSLDNP